MTKEQAEVQAKEYQYFINLPFISRVNWEIYIVDLVTANQITGSEKYQVLVTFHINKIEDLKTVCVENISVFLDVYSRA